MKKKRLLTALILSATCLFSLASCGEQGVKGDTGEKGDQGQKGDDGNPGKDGNDGKDGNSLLNGEGVPSDTLGNDGDTYIDSLTFNLYIKVNGKWTLKGNTKGDKGDTGEKGDTGSKGDTGDKGDKGDKGNTGSSGGQGEKGDTAWSNTILYSEYGTITPSAASMIADGKNEISFTVHHNDYEEARFSKLILRNPKLNEGKGELVINASDTKKFTTITDDHDYTYTTKMLEGGFVVSAEFVTNEEVTIDCSGSNFNVSRGDQTKCFVGDPVTLTIKPNNTNYRLKADKEGNYYININGNPVKVQKADGEYTYTCTVEMVKGGFTIADIDGYFESKKNVVIDNDNTSGNTITVKDNITEYFVDEKVTFIIKPKAGYGLVEFKINGGAPASALVSDGNGGYTCTVPMVENGLKASATWEQLYKLNVGSISNGGIEVYKYNSTNDSYEKISNYANAYFKKNDKIKVKFIPKSFVNTSITSSLSSVTIDSTTTLKPGDDSLTSEGNNVYSKEITFGEANISLSVNFNVEVLINDYNDLLNFKNDIEGISPSVNYNGVTVRLLSSIDLSGKDWNEPINCGNYKITFDGYGKTISNLVINKETNNVGFFRDVEGCTIKNLNFDGAKVTGTHEVGVIVGSTKNITITGCQVSNSTVIVTRGAWGALLVGTIDYGSSSSSITKCTVYGNNSVTACGSYAAFVGYYYGTLTFKENIINGQLTLYYDRTFDESISDSSDRWGNDNGDFIGSSDLDSKVKASANNNKNNQTTSRKDKGE